LLKGEEGKDQESRKANFPPAKPEFDENEDPINYFGFGIVSYFDFLKMCIFVFFILTVLHIPVMGIYGSYNYYSEETALKVPKLLSMGNMGYSKTRCSTSGMLSN